MVHSVHWHQQVPLNQQVQRVQRVLLGQEIRFDLIYQAVRLDLQVQAVRQGLVVQVDLK